MKMQYIRYKTILADPPWWETGGGKICRGAQKHYDLMKTPDIINTMKNVLADRIDDKAHLYLWVTNSHFQDGFRVIEALGFRYITCITWTKNRMGIGQYFRGLTEHCLFSVKGNLPYKYLPNGKRAQGVTGFYANKTIHSEKPEIIYEMIEKVSYYPYLELFARKERSNWDRWGTEINGEK